MKNIILVIAIVAGISFAQDIYELPGFKYPCTYMQRQQSQIGANTALSFEYRANGRYSRVSTYDANFENQLATQIVRPDITDEAGNVAMFIYQAGTCMVEYVPLNSTIRTEGKLIFTNREDAKWDGRNVYKYYNASSGYAVYADKKNNFIWGVELNSSNSIKNTTTVITEYRTAGLELSAYRLDREDFPLCPDDRIYERPSSDLVMCAAAMIKTSMVMAIFVIVALMNMI